MDNLATYRLPEQKCIESQYISLWRRLYADQKGTVLADKESDIFEIKRITKQADPVISTLYAAESRAGEDEGAGIRCVCVSVRHRDRDVPSYRKLVLDTLSLCLKKNILTNRHPVNYLFFGINSVE